MTPAERLWRRQGSASYRATSGQLLTVPPASLVNPLKAVVERRTAKTPEAWPGGPAAAYEALQSQSWRRRGEMGTHWYHCLCYPFRAFPLIAALVIMLSVLGTVTLFLIPVLLNLEIDGSRRLLLGGSLAVVWFGVVGYACAFFDCVLTSSAAGETRQVPWPGRSFGIVAAGIVTWLVCFISGPLVPSIGLLWFWNYLGDPAMVDKAIVAELAVIAATYWILAVLSVAESGRLASANPLKVADLAYELGLGALLLAFAGGVIAVVHCWWIYTGVIDFPRDPANAVLRLCACWTSGLFFATFLMRYLGLYCHQRRRMVQGSKVENLSPPKAGVVASLPT